jgi:hypothetical protein
LGSWEATEFGTGNGDGGKGEAGDSTELGCSGFFVFRYILYGLITRFMILCKACYLFVYKLQIILATDPHRNTQTCSYFRLNLPVEKLRMRKYELESNTKKIVIECLSEQINLLKI